MFSCLYVHSTLGCHGEACALCRCVWKGLILINMAFYVVYLACRKEANCDKVMSSRVDNQCESCLLRAACRMFNIYMISTAGVADEDIDKCLQCARPFWLILIPAGDAESVLWEEYGLSLTAHCCSLRIPEGYKCCSVPTTDVCKLVVCILIRPLQPNSTQDR